MYLIKNIKKLFLVSNVIFSLVVAFSAHAQEITAIDFNGSPIGKVIPDGKVVSFDNKLLGNVTADSLIVIEKGKMPETGTHIELLKQKGIYYRLYQLQLSALKNIGVEE